MPALAYYHRLRTHLWLLLDRAMHASLLYVVRKLKLMERRGTARLA